MKSFAEYLNEGLFDIHVADKIYDHLIPHMEKFHQERKRRFLRPKQLGINAKQLHPSFPNVHIIVKDGDRLSAEHHRSYLPGLWNRHTITMTVPHDAVRHGLTKSLFIHEFGHFSDVSHAIKTRGIDAAIDDALDYKAMMNKQDFGKYMNHPQEVSTYERQMAWLGRFLKTKNPTKARNYDELVARMKETVPGYFKHTTPENQKRVLDYYKKLYK
jgi:hypothetical protein